MATCGYVCPKCEGKGFLDDFSNCDWCSTTPLKNNNMITIYHNYQCSKSNLVLDYLTEKKLDFMVVDYLKNTPTFEELELLLKKLNITPIELVRKSEPLFIENYKDKIYSDAEWIKIMITNPILIERPIIVNGDKAVIGRPLEKVLTIL